MGLCELGLEKLHTRRDPSVSYTLRFKIEENELKLACRKGSFKRLLASSCWCDLHPLPLHPLTLTLYTLHPLREEGQNSGATLLFPLNCWDSLNYYNILPLCTREHHHLSSATKRPHMRKHQHLPTATKRPYG